MLLGLKSDLRTNPRCIDMLSAQGLTPVTTAQGLAVAAKMGATYTVSYTHLTLPTKRIV